MYHEYYVSYKILGAEDDVQFSRLFGIAAFSVAAFHCNFIHSFISTVSVIEKSYNVIILSRHCDNYLNSLLEKTS